ncbi:TPA: Cys-Gln thioester bond-forming surface protein [Clostridioides difficile]|uniref:thioester domain-containing protein n=1 Tax=Clostridioides difficile TaxID=1496 RepID=UPI00098009FE|nr:thioester domain-containing protein [Clostridioides difficile]AXU62334.1 surface protein [Clostridioides difficile]EGT4720788.1 cell surface protein [Clostridioides difficile]MCJ0328642.1 Cys-Gln thioester bond-forming surface protein [Clostridioides difficile]MCJ0520297.1 Cys-Gln thioester bond-forming surface protein [Clostridioides difficile]MCU5857245.1 Cys-Gln thioester bond-forming surface protein [Clostridioides difficile]
MKTKIKKSSIISLVIAFSMVFTAFTPIVSYADEVTSNDTILNGEEQSNGQTPDVEKPSDGQVPDGEKPSDSQVPDGEKPSDGQVPDGEKPSDGQIPDGEKPSDGQIPDGEKPSDGQIPDGEKPSDGQIPDGEKPSDGQMPDGEKPSDSQTPDVEKPSDGQMPDGEKPLDEQTPEEEKPLEEEIVIEEMSLKQDIDKILDMTLSQINKIVYNFWEDEEDVKADEQSEINQVFTSEDSFISLWYDKKAKVKNSCLLKEIDGSDRPYHDLRFDDITKTLTFDYVIKGLVGASSKDDKYVIEGEDGEQTAFCYNNHLRPPSSNGKSPYLPAEDFNGQENQNEEAVKSILYAGSEFDGFGYKQQFNLGGEENELMTYSATQSAIWIILGQMDEQERLKQYQGSINLCDKLIERAKTEEERAEYQKKKEVAINIKAYLEALLKAGREELKPNDTGKPSLSNGLTKINFEKNEDGTYETEAVALVGYSGVVKLRLPDGVTAYDGDGNIIGTGEVEISTQQKFKLKSVGKPDAKANISAVSYDYIFPKAIQYYKAVLDLGQKDHSSSLPSSKQNLLSYTIEKKNGQEVNFNIGLPTDDVVNPPVPPIDDDVVNPPVPPTDDTNGHKPKPSPPIDDTVINPPVPPMDDTIINPPVPPTEDAVLNPPVPPMEDAVLNPPVPPTDDTVLNPPVPPVSDTVEKTPELSRDDTIVKSPKTGDETQLMSYVFISVIAICGLAYQCKIKRN